MNLALAADLRVVAETARLLPGFLRIGLHPGGGYFVLSGRAAGGEATAAMGLFGEEVTGRRAAELGFAWEALPDDQVEEPGPGAGRPGRRRPRSSPAGRPGRSGTSWDRRPSPGRWPSTPSGAAQMWSLRRRPTQT